MFHESKMMQQHGIKARSSIYCVPEENRLLFFFFLYNMPSIFSSRENDRVHV